MNKFPELPKELFRGDQNDSTLHYTDVTSKQNLQKIIDHVEYTEQGILVYHKTFDYPEKGIRRNYIMQAVQFSKRILMVWVKFFSSKKLLPFYFLFSIFPWKFKIRLIEHCLDKYDEMIQLILRQYWLEDKYYSPMSMELRKGLEAFLINLGINKLTAWTFAITFATFFEYDKAYYYWLMDILSETSAPSLIRDPFNEVERLMKVFADRQSRTHAIEKFDQFARLLKIAFKFPKALKAFKTAISEIDFPKMQYDDADRYHVRNLNVGYDFFGMTTKERNEAWPPQHHDYEYVNYNHGV